MTLLAWLFAGLVWTAEAPASPDNLAQVRQQFLQLGEDTDKAEALLAELEVNDARHQPVIKGYYGVVQAMTASSGWNPFRKYKSFNEGKRLLEEAIRQDPDNPELRCLRFLMQSNTPSFLGYRAEQEQDVAAILSQISYCNEHPGYRDLLKALEPYVTKCKDCSSGLQQQLLQAINRPSNAS